MTLRPHPPAPASDVASATPLRPTRWRPDLVGSRAAGLAVLVALLALAGCGLPSHTAPKYAGPARSAAAAPDEVKTPPVPTDANTMSGLLGLYLQSSVGANLDTDGDSNGAGNETQERMRQFMTPDMRKRWAPGQNLWIVSDPEIHDTPTGAGELMLHVKGTLNEKGEFKPPPLGTRDIAFKYAVVTTAKGLLLSSVPNDVVLTESGLKQWYDAQPIYFWERGANPRKLVPDLRYMPRTLSATKRVSEVLRWLKAGPGQLLQSVASPWPENFEIKDNPVVDQATGDVKVNLSGKAAGGNANDLNRLARQIRWSLPGDPAEHKVTLTIESQPNDATSEGYAADDVAYERAGSNSGSTRFCVSNGVARPVAIPDDGGPVVLAPGSSNAQVVSAAINQQMDRAALVRQSGPKAPQQLYVSDKVVGTGPPKYTEVDSAPHLGRPAWMSYPVERLLISDGTRLLVSTDESAQAFEQLALSAPQNLAISAFAVAPEGHRIALIADDGERRLMVAPLQLDNNKLSIGTLQAITTSLGDNQAVGWLSETTLVVGGKPSPAPPSGVLPYSLVSITVDGAEETALPAGARTASQQEVTAVAVSTNSFYPSNQSIMVESNGAARNVYYNDIDTLKLSGPPLAATPSGAAEAATPTAPFFPN